jgi:hypothetical protein
MNLKSKIQAAANRANIDPVKPKNSNSAGSKKVNVSSRKGTESRFESTRTTNGGVFEPYSYKKTSMDTTGYSAGKKSFNVKTEYGYGDKTTGPVKTESKTSTIGRNQVPSTLNKIKKG